MTLEYDGTAFNGSQLQPGVRTVQAELERAVGKLTGQPENERVVVNLAGRTDTGVHAAGQVANFKTASHHSLVTFERGLNANLPFDIAVTAAHEVEDRFHARFSAIERCYEYSILNRLVRSALTRRYATLVTEPLDLTALKLASAQLPGEHDFASFAGMGWGVKSDDEAAHVPVGKNLTLRRVEQAEWFGRGDLLIFRVAANAFLPNMIRNLVGTLLLVGNGKLNLERFEEIFAACDRRQAGPTAPAQGLGLVQVKY